MSFDVDIAVRRGARTIALRFASSSQIVALWGPSGSGKTTMLDAIAGILKPQRGRIAVNGAALFNDASGIDLPPEARGCGYVFQDLRLFPHRSVRDNLLYGQRHAQGRPAAMTLDEAGGLLGIGNLLDRRPPTLSGGEAQRVAIGRALMAAPRFLLLDEPLSSLDPSRREDTASLIERICAQLRLPLLLVTHERSETERFSADVVSMPS